MNVDRSDMTPEWLVYVVAPLDSVSTVPEVRASGWYSGKE